MPASLSKAGNGSKRRRRGTAKSSTAAAASPSPAPTASSSLRAVVTGKLDSAALKAASECLRILAHPHRLQMLEMLLAGRYTVGELAQACGIPSHMASEHLRLMERCGFLTHSKDGRRAYYEIIEPHVGRILSCIEDRFGAA